MKKCAKVFIILGCVFEAALIFPLVIGVIAYKKLDTVTSKEEITGWAIAVLLLVNLIAGICMLVMTDDDFSENARQSAANATKKQENDAYESLIRLKKLLDDGIITQEVYEKKKNEYLSSI